MGRRAQRAAQRAAIHPHEVRLGRINGVFGLKGEVRLFLYNPKTELFNGEGMDATLVSPDGERRATHIRSRSGAGKRILGRLDGVHSPESAASLADWEIVCDESVLPVLHADEYYHRDLIGLAVQNQSGEGFGRITEIVPGDMVDCWVAKHDGEEFMFPAVKEVVLSVDLHTGITIVDEFEEIEG